MDIRICTKCGKELPATTEYFYKNKAGKFGLFSHCIKCCKKYSKQRHKKERVQILKRQKEYRQSEIGKALRKNYCESKRGKAAKRKYRQSEKGKKAHKKYGQSEKGKVQRKRYRKSEIGKAATKRFYNKNKLACSMSTMIWQALKKNKAGRHWEILVPYTLEDLKQHLENLFQPKMSWNNYGEWHVDHKIPRSSFKFANSEDKEFQKCWALKNLQPLWEKENLRKRNKLVW
jgi:hypothetical protein